MTVPKAIQIRDVPDDVHATLRARAAAAGMSLSDYLRDELVELARLPDISDVLARAQARHGSADTATIVRIIRAARDAGDELP